MMEVLSYGIGTLIAFAIVLRNYPVVGHLRYFFEQLGEYFRQYFSSGDPEDLQAISFQQRQAFYRCD